MQLKYKLCKQSACLLGFCRSMSSQTIKVQIKSGVIVGKQDRLTNGGQYNSFQGIPYAVPPVGELRFHAPIPLEKLPVSELDCTQERDIAFHLDTFTQSIVGSEDCLFVNVYAPTTQSRGPLPVMIFVHGGGFFFGNSHSEYHFPMKLMEEDVIVVTFNYRLGALGFLCFPEAGIWGNMGLKDQRLAMQWVHENIEQFNGDPKNVTIFGESAGGGACHLHCYTKHAHKFFHKAIMQSGTCNTEWMFQKDPSLKAIRIAELLGCSSKVPNDILKYLKSKAVTPVHLLAQTIPVLTPEERRRCLPLTFLPVIESKNSPDPIITKPILELLKAPDILAMPTIIGYNNGEGLGFLGNTIRKAKEYDSDFVRFVPRNIPLPVDSPTMHEIADRMRKFYLDGNSISPKVYERMANLLADYHFTVDMQNAAEWQVRYQSNAPAYFFRFDYLGNRNYYKKLYKLEYLSGASHGDDLAYLFQFASDPKSNDPDDDLFSQKFAHLWANFAKYGNPTPNGAEPPIIQEAWLPVRKPSTEDGPFKLNYYVIDKHCRMEENLERERVEFWRDIYKRFQPIDYSKLSAKL